MGDLRPFQIILIGVFSALAVGGLIFFALFRGFGGEPNPYGERVLLWGSLNAVAFNEVIDAIESVDDNFSVVTYVQKDPRTFHSELVNAVAEGRGPDAIVLSSEMLVQERAKIYPIPYTRLTPRDIRDTYVDGAEIFALSDGVYGLPIAVDPLVMYWNRDLFAAAGLAQPPATWEVMTNTTVPALVRFAETPRFTIEQAALAFGEYTNIVHATKILLLLMLQAGSELIDERVGGYDINLNREVSGMSREPATAALDFYTQFANPSRPVYTWNRSLSNDRNAFLAGDLAIYFAPGSEYASIAAGNPNLNFDAAPVPQGQGAVTRKGYGTFYALSLLRSSPNPSGTFQALVNISAEAYAPTLTEYLGLAPVHRSTLSVGNQNPFRQTMYSASLFARGFLNPNPTLTENAMQTMVEDITSGRQGLTGAITDVIGRLNQSLP